MLRMAQNVPIALEVSGLYISADYYSTVKVHHTSLWHSDLTVPILTNGGGTFSTWEIAGSTVDWFGCCPRTACD